MEQFLGILQEWLELLAPNRFAQAAVIVAVSFIVARIADWLLCRVISAWARRTTTDFDDRLIEYLHRPIFVSVFLAGLGLATVKLGLPETVRWVTLAALETIVIAVWLVFAFRFTSLLLSLLSRHADRFSLVDARTVPLLDNVSKFLFFGAAVYFLFLAWEIDVTAWLASAGIVGLALSFAAKDTLANLFAGFFILTDAPYKVGDYIILDTGERGMVTQIGVRSTRLLTRDDVEVTIPNSVMGNAKIVNESGGPYEKQRIRIRIGAAYGSDVDRVRQVLMDVARGISGICEDPEPRVRFRSFGESSLDFELLVWVMEPALRGRVQDALNTEIYKSFQRSGIEIPFPKRDVYVREMPTASPKLEP